MDVSSEGHVSKRAFERYKWLGCFNTRGHIQDIKRTNADVASSTTMVEFQEWMPIRVLTGCKKQWGIESHRQLQN